jgi:hypothetical protein
MHYGRPVRGKNGGTNDPRFCGICKLSGYLPLFGRMYKVKIFMICMAISAVGINRCCSQNRDTVKPNKESAVHPYFIITAGTEINAFFNDKPISASSISEFNDYVQLNVKSLRDSWVVVTGKPNYGTFNEVLKTLSHYRFKHITKNIKDL